MDSSKKMHSKKMGPPPLPKKAKADPADNSKKMGPPPANKKAKINPDDSKEMGPPPAKTAKINPADSVKEDSGTSSAAKDGKAAVDNNGEANKAGGKAGEAGKAKQTGEIHDTSHAGGTKVDNHADDNGLTETAHDGKGKGKGKETAFKDDNTTGSDTGTGTGTIASSSITVGGIDNSNSNSRVTPSGERRTISIHSQLYPGGPEVVKYFTLQEYAQSESARNHRALCAVLEASGASGARSSSVAFRAFGAAGASATSGAAGASPTSGVSGAPGGSGAPDATAEVDSAASSPLSSPPSSPVSYWPHIPENDWPQLQIAADAILARELQEEEERQQREASRRVTRSRSASVSSQARTPLPPSAVRPRLPMKRTRASRRAAVAAGLMSDSDDAASTASSSIDLSVFSPGWVSPMRHVPSVVPEGVFARSGAYAASWDASSFRDVDPRTLNHPSFGSYTRVPMPTTGRWVERVRNEQQNLQPSQVPERGLDAIDEETEINADADADADADDDLMDEDEKIYADIPILDIPSVPPKKN